MNITEENELILRAIKWGMKTADTVSSAGGSAAFSLTEFYSLCFVII